MNGSSTGDMLAPGGASLPARLRELARRYPRGLPTLALVGMFSVYFLIAALTPGRTLHTLDTAVDRAVPLRPAWMIVYGSVYVFLFLPLFVVVDPKLFRRVVPTSLTVMVVAYLGFLGFPTVGPRPESVAGSGLFEFALRFNYRMDPPFNCFPSLHVAHAFVAVLSCARVHRGVGFAAGVWATLIAISTLYTKQHYLADVLAGLVLAVLAARVFLGDYPRSAVSEGDRRLAPRRALGAVAVYSCVFVGFVVAWRMERG